MTRPRFFFFFGGGGVDWFCQRQNLKPLALKLTTPLSSDLGIYFPLIAANLEL